MAIAVNIGQAKTRLSELIAASERGEEVVLQRSGVPAARITPIESNTPTPEQIAADRSKAFGMFAKEYRGYDISLESLKRARIDYDEKFRLKNLADR